MLMNITTHSVEVNTVRIMNQILDIVCLLANFHPNSSGNCSDQVVVLIDGADWSSVNWKEY